VTPLTYIEAGHLVTVTSHPLLQRGRPKRAQEVHAIAGHSETFGGRIAVAQFLANKTCSHPEAEVARG
jgi:hypothetical protein